MHYVLAVEIHPICQYWVVQSLDNTIVVYQADDQLSLQRNKRFVGHKVAVYTCYLLLIPDGKFVTAGYGEGRLQF